MSYSSLTSQYLPAYVGNYTQGRRGYKICKITPHHMAGKLTAAQCANIFANPARQASSNYGIGYDGEIACYVDEENRAWTSSNRENDCQAITIEISNSSTGGDWPISDASWNSLVNLCVDICRRYEFRLDYTGDKDGSLTRHNMFANTNCPGPYLESRFPELAQTVNKILDGAQPEPEPTPIESYLVKITADSLNIRKGPGTNYAIVGAITDHGTYTIVAESEGAGASLWGKLKSGAGWISLDYTSRNNANVPSGRKLGDVVVINGVYTSSSSDKKLKPAVTSGTITKILNGARNPYLLNNGNIGWINEDCIVDNSIPSPAPTHVLGLYVVNTPAGLNVRKGPGTNYSVIRVYKNGTRFDTYELSGDWARTPSGWVNLKYCSLVRAY